MSLLKKYKNEADQFIEVCRLLSDRHFVTSCGGNLAWKLEDNLVMITATCLNKGEHTPEDIVFIDLEGNTVEGKNRPTGEVPMYLAFFRERPDISCVIHCHPVSCGAYAITGEENLLMRPVYPEVILEIGPVPVVGYATPLTEKLADNFKPFLQKYNAFLMENHGLVIMTSRDIKWAYFLTDELEGAAESMLKAQAVGRVKEIAKDELEEMDNIINIRSLPRCGAPGVNKSLMELYFGEVD